MNELLLSFSVWFILPQPGQACWGSLTSVTLTLWSGFCAYLMSPLKTLLNSKRRQSSRFVPTCAWVLGRWLLSLSPNVFLQFSSHCEIRIQEWIQDNRTQKGDGKKRLTQRLQIVCSQLVTCIYMCMYKIKTWTARYFKCVVLSKIKKASADVMDSIQPSRHHRSLIQLAPLHPRILCNIISLPLPPHSLSHCFPCQGFSIWFKNNRK